MSSPDQVPPRGPHPNSSHGPATGPYGPRNTLNASQEPSFTTDSRNAPKFGSTTPMKSDFVRIPYRTPQDPVRAELAPRAFVSAVNARADEFLQPLPLKNSRDHWRPRPTVDLTGPIGNDDDSPVAIQRPQAFPTFHSASYMNPAEPGFGFVNSNNFVDLTGGRKLPPAFSIPGGGAVAGANGSYYGGTYVDHEKTTESIKELLEGINDSPPARKKKGKKRERKVDDELADMMEEKAVLGDSVKREEEGEEEEEEDEEEEDESDVVDGLNVSLLPHQIRGLKFLRSREEGKARGGILADDMGLGKTIQTISLILSHPHPQHPISSKSTFSSLSPDSKKAALKLPSDLEKGTLVIAPLALIKQWEAEIAGRTEKSHKMRVRVHHGPNRAKDSALLRKYDVVITTYDVVRSEHKDAEGSGKLVGCFGLRWWRIVLDEAHTIKNRLAKGSLAACALRARYRWCLTGTPLQNKIEEMQSLIKFLRVAPFDDLAVWKEQIARPMSQGREAVAIKRLRVVLGAIMLRRTKDVLRADGERLERAGGENKMKMVQRKVESVVAEFDGREKEFYEKLEARTEESLEKMLSGFGVGGKGLGGVNMTSALLLLLRLRQACNHPQLVAGKIHKDKDSGLGLATPRKRSTPKPLEQDEALGDELADLLGGLSVDSRKCDVCFSDLTKEESECGEPRCADCRADLEQLERAATKDKRNVNGSGGPQRLKKRGRLVVLDSDDEDEDETGEAPICEDEDSGEGSQAKEVREDSEDGEEDVKAYAYEDDDEGGGGSQAEEGTDTSDDGDAPIRSNMARKPARRLIDHKVKEVDEDYEEDDEYSSLVISTKIKHLLVILEEELKENNKTIVFSQFTSMLDLIEPFLYRENIAFARYDGSMKNDAREASLRRLRGEGEYANKKGAEKEFCGVLLCSLKCGALGLNLVAACRVVILEPFWNPFIEEQAIDRVHRIGQVTDVVVYKLTVAGSVEERILKLQEQKRELAKAAFGDGDGGLGKAKAAKLSMKDILYLFRRDAETAPEPSAAAAKGLGSRTRVLKDRGYDGRDSDKGAGYSREVQGRYVSPEAEEISQRRRMAEANSLFGRR